MKLRGASIPGIFARLRLSREEGFTLTELVFVVVIVCAFIALLTPFIRDIRNKARIIACRENLQEIGLGLKLYASEHRERFPAGLGELVEGSYIWSERCLDCPQSPHAGDAKDPDYHYVTGHTLASPSEIEIVFDKTENHKEGKYILYLSGDIKWLAGGVPK
ncbi:MAG: type II secretion system GspH family protein [Omnitrophica bacterium]|nr:type II secretion system GspH family protein [Candidatus Omnitrophota bacterium]